MKFSHSLQFNAVPDWSNQYIAYSSLKGLIYRLEKEKVQRGNGGDTESGALIASSPDTDEIFTRALDNELQKITSFYAVKQAELFEEAETLRRDEERFQEDAVQQRRSSEFGTRLSRPKSNVSKRRRSSSIMSDEGSDNSDEEAHAGPHQRQKSLPTTSFSTRRESLRRASIWEDYLKDNDVFNDQIITLKKRSTSCFVALSELQSYRQLNRQGFTKALKKYDKTLDRSLKQVYLREKVDAAEMFSDETARKVDAEIEVMKDIYARNVTNGDVEAAAAELKLQLREHVVWERNTVWRDLIGIERKAQAAQLGSRGLLTGTASDSKKTARQQQSSMTKEIDTPVGRVRFPAFLCNSSIYILAGIWAVFAILVATPTMEQVEQRNCLALLVLVSMLWATEVIPLFVTSLLVPFMVVVLGVVRSDDTAHVRLDAPAATKYIFSAMWTPVVMLLLGGFAIAAALSKYQIAKVLATWVLSKAGTRPKNVLVANMFVAMVTSMWISNVAAPVLCLSIVQPLLRTLPTGSSFAKVLILGIAMASNIGGMASPIASPQNVIALQNMDPIPDWFQWFFVSIPVCVFSTLIVWVVLLVSFRDSRSTTLAQIRPSKDPFTGIQYFISAVTVITILLWCLSHKLQNVVGDMGVLAIVPLVVFFGTGILTKEDFNNFLWTIIVLAMGGIALGKAVQSSGLLDTIANWIQEAVSDFGLFSVVLIFGLLILVVATFISHTVAALIMLPIVKEVGENMANPHPRLLVMASALLCSAAMGLPTSGFPNMTAIMAENNVGERYLSVKDFIVRGVPCSVLTYIVVVTIGYGLMIAAGF